MSQKVKRCSRKFKQKMFLRSAKTRLVLKYDPATPSTELRGKYEEAEPLYERSQAIREKMLGPERPDLAASLKNRALLLTTRGKYAEAEPLYERSQAIREKMLGPEHPDVATTVNNRAELLRVQARVARTFQ
ncbi:unnamed protein product [Ectocarpus sp. 12 AP-2014]